MERISVHTIIVWVMMVAYAALLAHAFVPHHHHSDGTAFLNHDTCPHEHTPDTPNQGACETLSHTWLKTHSPEISRIERTTTYSWDFTTIALHLYLPATPGFSSKKRYPWLMGKSSYLLVPDAIGLRAPPFYS